MCLTGLAICTLLVACASRPVLVSRSGVVPAGVNFSGQWRLRVAPESNGTPGKYEEPLFRLPPAQSRSGRVPRPPRGAPGPAVSVFLENGEDLKISQTPAGLFISFDRAVVEEYTFGENRIVSVGPIEAQRVSGWEGGTFVIETLDEEGAILIETWELLERGQVLSREIIVRQGDRETLSVSQRFDRA